MHVFVVVCVGVVLSAWFLRTLAFGKARETTAEAKRRAWNTEEAA